MRKRLVIFFFVCVLVLLVPSVMAQASPFVHNAVLIQNEDWVPMQSVLENHLSDVSARLASNYIDTAIVFIGFIDSNGVISQERTNSQLISVVNAFHSIGVTVKLWVENNANLNLDVNHRGAIYTQIENILLATGADGHWDDIELEGIPYNQAVRQTWLDYQNGGSVFLASIGKTWSTAYGIDWVTNVNHFLVVSGGIYTMCYSESTSAFEDGVNMDYYWLENMGLREYSAYAPGSPVTIIVMVNGFDGEKDLSFQLNAIHSLVARFGAGPLNGVCFWVYETTTAKNWNQINSFLSNPSVPLASQPPYQGGGGGNGGSGGGWWTNPLPSSIPNATQIKSAFNSDVQFVLSIFNGVTGGGKLFLLLAVGVVAFVFAGKKH